jgi:hypothetical protein
MRRLDDLTFLPDSLGLAVANFKDDVRQTVVLSGLSGRGLEFSSAVNKLARTESWLAHSIKQKLKRRTKYYRAS